MFWTVFGAAFAVQTIWAIIGFCFGYFSEPNHKTYKDFDAIRNDANEKFLELTDWNPEMDYPCGEYDNTIWPYTILNEKLYIRHLVESMYKKKATDAEIKDVLKYYKLLEEVNEKGFNYLQARRDFNIANLVDKYLL